MQSAIEFDTLLGVAGFFNYLIFAIICLRQGRGISPAFLVTAVALVAYIGVLVFSILSRTHGNFWVTSVGFWFPTLTFLMGFGALHKSISLGIIRYLLLQPNQTAS